MDCDCQDGGPQEPDTTLDPEEQPASPCEHAALIPILEKRLFDFSNLEPTGATPSDVNYVVCPARYVLGSYRVRLAVRIHSLTISTGQSIQFLLYGSLPSEEDPSREFVDEANPFLVLTIDENSTAPSLATATATDPDAYLKIIIRGVQGVSPSILSAQLSASLVLRTF